MNVRATYDPELPALLRQLERCLVLSTYTSGYVLRLRPDAAGTTLVQTAQEFERPMGLATDGERLAVAAAEDLVLLDAAATTPPRRHHTGRLDLHDVVWEGDDLWAVNTRYSSIDRLRGGQLEAVWRPSFVSDLTPDDRCHLNGLAVVDGEPTWATALGATDEAGAWRQDRQRGGVLIHIPSGETVLGGLAMPHSPRVYDRRLFFLLAARGEVCRVDPQRRSWEVIARVPGFARGLARAGGYLFVGHSRVRGHHLFSDMPVNESEQVAGVSVVELVSGKIVAGVRFLSGCEEIYDVQLTAWKAGQDVAQDGAAGEGAVATTPGFRAPDGWDDRQCDERDASPARNRPPAPRRYSPPRSADCGR